jgi:hypothetical protein
VYWYSAAIRYSYKRTMRLILLLCSLSSYAAFQSRFEVHSGLRARLLEHVASTAPRLSFTHQSSKGRRRRSCGDMRPLHSDNDKENDIIHAGSLDAANEFDDVLDKVDVGLESLPADVREELYSNQPSEMIVLKNVWYMNRIVRLV